MKKYIRPDFDEIFINMLQEISKLATCDRGRTSALIVKDTRPISMGYVGSLPGLPHCDDVGHDFREITKNGKTSKHCIRTVHAEANAIYFCAKNGISTNNCTMYCVLQPCRKCAEAIITCGISRVVFMYFYYDKNQSEEVLKLFDECNVQYKCWTNEILKYK